MLSPANWNLLLVASDPWDAGLLEEALSELDENQYARSFQRPIAWQRAECLDDARDLAATGDYDVVLLDLHLSDSDGLHTYLRLKAKAPDVPVIILIDRKSEDLGVAAMREGAQDYLVKEDLDCQPLGRSIRYVMERHQHALASAAHAGIDKLTGLLDASEFLHRAGYAVDLAMQLRLNVSLTLLEIAADEYQTTTSDRTLDVLEIADRMRSIFEHPDLVARISPLRYAALRVAPTSEPPSPSWVTPSGIPVVHGHSGFSAGLPRQLSVLMAEAEKALCENKLQTIDSLNRHD